MVRIAAMVLFAIERWAATVLMLQMLAPMVMVLLMMVMVVAIGNHTFDFHIMLSANHVWAENSVGHDVWRMFWAALRRCHYRLSVVHVMAIRTRLMNHVFHVLLAVIVVVRDYMIWRASRYR